MAKQVQFRRGTTSQTNAFTGAAGEITVDTDKNTAVVHDGSTAGGFPLVAKDSSGNATFDDNEKAIFGAGSDLQIYHDGSNSRIHDAGTGDLLINGQSNIVLGALSGEEYLRATENGAVSIKYDNATKLATASNGITVTGNVAADSISLNDNDVAYFGTSNDLQIYHASGESYIEDVGSGDLSIRTNGNRVLIATTNGEAMGRFEANSYAKLYYDNAEKISTTSVGADVTGEFIADSYNETYAALSGTSPAVNCETGNSFSLVLSGNSTFTFTNPPASGTSYSFSIEIIQDASASGYTVTWPSSVDWPAATAPTLTATASAKDIFVFTTRDGGTNWYGFTAGQALG